MKTKTIHAPTIHLNGSSGKALLQGHLEAMKAIRETINKLREIAPHGRDYYVQQDSQVFQVADQEFRARVEALQKVHDDLREIAWDIKNQLDARIKK